MDEPNENTLWSCCVTISVKYLVISDTFQNAQSMLMSFVVLGVFYLLELLTLYIECCMPLLNCTMCSFGLCC